jgi:hypothetical protein
LKVQNRGARLPRSPEIVPDMHFGGARSLISDEDIGYGELTGLSKII